MSPEDLKRFGDESWAALEALLGKTIEQDLDEQLREAMELALIQMASIPMQTKKSETALKTLKDCARRMDREELRWSDWCRLSKLDPGKAELELFDPVMAVAGKVLRHPRLHKDLEQIITGAFGCAGEALAEYDLYKREHGLMDFVDQEAKTLRIALDNPAFRDSLSQRINLLLVDEFQDTSPIQLALFLALHDLAGASVFVGDPKQAIYGFRGTDPQLMEEVVARIQDTQVLGDSWRSREKLLDFSNALFTQAFHTIDENKIHLAVPALRKELAKGGELESWHLAGSNKDAANRAAAMGVRDLLLRHPELAPGEVAVLCRTNTACASIAEELEKLGIRASAGQGALLSARECRLAVAALRFMNNQADKLALVELIQGLWDGSAGADWLTILLSDPKAAKAAWESHPLAAGLSEGRDNMKYWTPLEALEEAIHRTGLVRRIKTWPNPGLASGNLDALRLACKTYMDLCAARRSAVTVEGFIKHLRETEIEQAKGTDETAVNVLTYHKAKGLEWPWVILTDLDSLREPSVFGVSVEAAAQFDLARPLEGRSIRYWPWPFGDQKSIPELTERIQGIPLAGTVRQRELREAQRLLYVGITRARDGLALALRRLTPKSGDSLKTAWLDALTGPDGNPVLEWPLEAGQQSLSIGGARIPIQQILYDAGEDNPAAPAAMGPVYLPALPATPERFVPARVSPSGLGEEESGLAGRRWEILHRFGQRMAIVGKPPMDRVGSAVHGFFGADDLGLSEAERVRRAAQNLEDWGVSNAVDSGELAAAGRQLLEYLESRYPEGILRREWPLSLHGANGQHLQGWMDLLIELPQGFVLLDHKDHEEKPGEPAHSIEEAMLQYLPQMSAYIRTIEAASGKPVLDTILHLPAQGLLLHLAPEGV
jgi:ATP-dependent exoDNAse (exonuclease V) beta subunit